MARTGKIARLPRPIRDQLNRRLDDGESGVRLVEWLNELPEVRQVLEQEFGGRPIGEQNLTEWKQGGFLTWLREQDSCEWVRLVSGEADHLAEESGLMPLSDRLSATVALVLGKAVHGLSADSLADPETGKHLLLLLRELTRVRRADHEAARLRMDLEQYDRQKTRQRRDDLKEAEYAAERAAEKAARDKIARENAAIIEEANRRYRSRSKGSSSKHPKQTPPPDPLPASSLLVGTQTESGQIKPNQPSCAPIQASERPDSSRPP